MNGQSEISKNKNDLLLVIGILLVLVLLLGGYIVYDKLLSSSENGKDVKIEDKTDEVDQKNTYKSYDVGDKVKVKLNNSLEMTFYVLKQSSDNEKLITLFAEKNIGTSAFNNDSKDGNEYKGSLIENNLGKLTSNWTNVKEKRLITVEEIKSTGLTEVQKEDRCQAIEGSCPDDYTYIKENTFLLYPSKDYDTFENYEMYWTMTKLEGSTYLVYYINSMREIDQSVVGYEPGSEWNKDGKTFEDFGIRPVIVIAKEFVS